MVLIEKMLISTTNMMMKRTLKHIFYPIMIRSKKCRNNPLFQQSIKLLNSTHILSQDERIEPSSIIRANQSRQNKVDSKLAYNQSNPTLRLHNYRNEKLIPPLNWN